MMATQRLLDDVIRRARPEIGSDIVSNVSSSDGRYDSSGPDPDMPALITPPGDDEPVLVPEFDPAEWTVTDSD